LKSIHARDIRIGRTDTFVLDQFWIATNPPTVPLWLAGLFYLFATQEGKRYRPIGWMFIVPFALFVIGRGRGYYMGGGKDSSKMHTDRPLEPKMASPGQR
jgi:hypothetical protein